jgi:hypothetical protein
LFATVACSGPNLLKESSSARSDEALASDDYEDNEDEDDDDEYSAEGLSIESPACAENYSGMAARSFLVYQWLMSTFVIRMQNTIAAQPAAKLGISTLQSDSCPTVTNDGEAEFGLDFGVGCYIGRDLFAGSIYAGYQADIDTIVANAFIANFEMGSEELALKLFGNVGIETGDGGTVAFSSIVKMDLPVGYGSIEKIELTTNQQWQQVIGAESIETSVDGLADLDVGSVGYAVVITAMRLDSRCYFPVGGQLDIGNSSITFSAASCHSGIVDLSIDGASAEEVSIYQQFFRVSENITCDDGYGTCIDDCGSTECENICTNAYCSDVVVSTCDMVADDCSLECAVTDPFDSACPRSCDNVWRTCCEDEKDCSCYD